MQSKNATQNKNKDYNYTQTVLNVGGLIHTPPFYLPIYLFIFLGGEWHTSDWMKKRFEYLHVSFLSQSLLEPMQARKEILYLKVQCG